MKGVAKNSMLSDVENDCLVILPFYRTTNYKGLMAPDEQITKDFVMTYPDLHRILSDKHTSNKHRDTRVNVYTNDYVKNPIGLVSDKHLITYYIWGYTLLSRPYANYSLQDIDLLDAELQQALKNHPVNSKILIGLPSKAGPKTNKNLLPYLATITDNITVYSH